MGASRSPWTASRFSSEAAQSSLEVKAQAGSCERQRRHPRHAPADLRAHGASGAGSVSPTRKSMLAGGSSVADGAPVAEHDRICCVVQFAAEKPPFISTTRREPKHGRHDLWRAHVDVRCSPCSPEELLVGDCDRRRGLAGSDARRNGPRTFSVPLFMRSRREFRRLRRALAEAIESVVRISSGPPPSPSLCTFSYHRSRRGRRRPPFRGLAGRRRPQSKYESHLAGPQPQNPPPILGRSVPYFGCVVVPNETGLSTTTHCIPSLSSQWPRWL
jgi:hypothetical protein